MLASNRNQMIYPLGINIAWETRSQYNTLGERHFWVTRPSSITNKDYATTARPENDGRDGCKLDQIIADANATIRIAVPINNMNVTGWTRTNDFIETSITRLYIYTYNYTRPNTWINVPYFDVDKPTIVFADRGKLKFDNPIPLSSLGSDPVMIFDGKSEWNRKGTVVDPNIIILPNGDYIAGMNSRRYLSTNKGVTWTRLGNYDVRHASTFYLNNALYIIGDDFHDNPKTAQITKSTDGGRTWSAKVNLNFNSRNSPSQVEISQGRVWFANERYDTHEITIASASVNSDLMNPASWRVTSRTDDWTYSSREADREPCMVMGPDGWPIALPEKGPPIRANSVTTSSAMFPASQFNLPGSNGKFDAKYDAVSGRYWALTSDSPIAGNQRTGITLFSSTDLKTWKKEKVVMQGTSRAFHGFNYPFLQFDGNDIIFVLRTAFENENGQPQRWHDANMFTFQRIKNFRSISNPITCAILPFLNINDAGWNTVATASVNVGDKVWFGPQSQQFGGAGGNWTWTGPNGVTHNGREFTINNIQSNQSGTYTVKNIDSNNCTATFNFNITVIGACNIIPYLNINDRGWNTIGTATVSVGNKVWFGPQSEEFGATGGNWSYTGPNNATYTGRSLVLNNIQTNQSGVYTVKNIDSRGCTATYTFTITVTSPVTSNTITVDGSPFEIRSFANNIALFTNRTHKLENIRTLFNGFEFAASDGGVVNGGTIIPSQNGLVYIIAPTSGVAGWDLVANSTFNYSDPGRTSLSIFIKLAIANTPIILPTITSFPGVSPLAKKVVNANQIGITVNGAGFESRNFANDVPLFTNRTHQLQNIPEAFKDYKFLASDGKVANQGTITPQNNGYVYVIAPPSGAGMNGWELVPNATFNYSDTGNTPVTIFRKSAVANTAIAIPNVTSFPGASPIAKTINYGGATNRIQTSEKIYEITVFPNPVVEETFTISTKDINASEILITNFTGKVIFEKQIEDSKLDSFTLQKPSNPGIYLITVKGLDGVLYASKLIVL